MNAVLVDDELLALKLAPQPAAQTVAEPMKDDRTIVSLLVPQPAAQTVEQP